LIILAIVPCEGKGGRSTLTGMVTSRNSLGKDIIDESFYIENKKGPAVRLP
jgi:hypothetical protein